MTDKIEIDTDLIDDTVLALLYLKTHDADRISGRARAWKTFSWKVMDRLYEKGLIGDPASKAKSVVLTAEEAASPSRSAKGAIYPRRSRIGDP